MNGKWMKMCCKQRFVQLNEFWTCNRIYTLHLKWKTWKEQKTLNQTRPDSTGNAHCSNDMHNVGFSWPIRCSFVDELQISRMNEINREKSSWSSNASIRQNLHKTQMKANGHNAPYVHFENKIEIEKWNLCIFQILMWMRAHVTCYFEYRCLNVYIKVSYSTTTDNSSDK